MPPKSPNIAPGKVRTSYDKAEFDKVVKAAKSQSLPLAAFQKQCVLLVMKQIDTDKNFSFLNK